MVPACATLEEIDETIYLVHIYGKSRKSNLTKAEQNTLRQIAHEIRNLGRP